jgi:carboxypeptidase Taq
MDTFNELKLKLAIVHDLNMAGAVLSWDNETYMPPGGAEARAQQMGTLNSLAHEKFTSDEIGKLLDELKEYEASLPYDSDEASLIRVARREYQRRTRVPTEFVARMTETQALSYNEWVKARPQSDFAAVTPWLEKFWICRRSIRRFFHRTEKARRRMWRTR